MANQNSWKDISVVILGRTIEGIVDVKYKKSAVKEYTYGRGDKPTGIVSGNKAYEGTIVLLQSELEAMVVAATAADRDLTDISFDIVIDYESTAGLPATDILVGAEFKEYEKGMAQGDTHMKVTLPIIALDLRENV